MALEPPHLSHTDMIGLRKLRSCTAYCQNIDGSVANFAVVSLPLLILIDLKSKALTPTLTSLLGIKRQINLKALVAAGKNHRASDSAG